MRPTSIAKPTSDQAGFSLIELLLATILSTMIVVVFVSALLTMVRTATAQKTQLELTGQGQLALDIVERDIRLATSFDTTIPTQFTDSYGPSMTTSGWSGTWSYKGSDAANRVLILNQIATTTPPLNENRTPIYDKIHMVSQLFSTAHRTLKPHHMARSPRIIACPTTLCISYATTRCIVEP